MPKNDSVQNIVDFLQLMGYQGCQDSSLIDGIEKVAIYAGPLGPLHLARQLIDGRWASKLGPYADVIHSAPETVGGGDYGEPVRYMAIRRSVNRPQLPDLHPGKPRLITPGGGVLIQ